MNQETYEIYDKIIKKTVYDYLRTHGMDSRDAEDYCQDLWMTLLEYQKEKGELPDYKLAKTICQRRLIDKIRSSIRRGHANVDFDNEYGSYDDDDSEDYTYSDTVMLPYLDAQSRSDINFLLKQFPEDSPERKYLDFYIEKANIDDKGVRPSSGREQDGYTDSNLARSLGFAGTGDRGWKRFKSRMQSIIKDYYGRS